MEHRIKCQRDRTATVHSLKKKLYTIHYTLEPAKRIIQPRRRLAVILEPHEEIHVLRARARARACARRLPRPSPALLPRGRRRAADIPLCDERLHAHRPRRVGVAARAGPAQTRRPAGFRGAAAEARAGVVGWDRGRRVEGVDGADDRGGPAAATVLG